MASERCLEVTRRNWFENHPKFKEVQAYGYYKDRPNLLRAAMLVYLDLCEVKHWFSVQVHPCESLKLVYITGKPTKKAEVEQIVPVDIRTSLTMEDIQSFISEVSACESESCGVDAAALPRHPSVTLAFCETDSTIVYYKMFDGLVPPDPPTQNEEAKDKKTKSRRRYKRKKPD